MLGARRGGQSHRHATRISSGLSIVRGESNKNKMKPSSLTSCFLGCRVTTTDHGQRFLPEYRNCTIANGAGADPALPIYIFARQPHPLRAGTRGNDDRIGCLWLVILLLLAPVPERSLGEVDFGDGLRDDGGAEADGLLTEFVHEFWTHYSTREAREILHCVG